MYLLSKQNGDDSDAKSQHGGMKRGDILVLGGSFCWSVYIFRMSRIGKPHSEIKLQAYKTFILTLLDTSWMILSTLRSNGSTGGIMSLWQGWQNLAAWALLFYSAMAPGILADVLHQIGQKKLSPSNASVILSMEPIFSSICAMIVLDEQPTAKESLGGGLILIAALLVSTTAKLN